jgi:hypothetical protein
MDLNNVLNRVDGLCQIAGFLPPPWSSIRAHA